MFLRWLAALTFLFAVLGVGCAAPAEDVDRARSAVAVAPPAECASNFDPACKADEVCAVDRGSTRGRCRPATEISSCGTYDVALPAPLSSPASSPSIASTAEGEARIALAITGKRPGGTAVQDPNALMPRFFTSERAEMTRLREYVAASAANARELAARYVALHEKRARAHEIAEAIAAELPPGSDHGSLRACEGIVARVHKGLSSTPVKLDANDLELTRTCVDVIYPEMLDVFQRAGVATLVNLPSMRAALATLRRHVLDLDRLDVGCVDRVKALELPSGLRSYAEVLYQSFRLAENRYPITEIVVDDGGLFGIGKKRLYEVARDRPEAFVEALAGSKGALARIETLFAELERRTWSLDKDGGELALIGAALDLPSALPQLAQPFLAFERRVLSGDVGWGRLGLTAACLGGVGAAALLSGPASVVVGALGLGFCIIDAALSIKDALDATYLAAVARTLASNGVTSSLARDEDARKLTGASVGAWVFAALSVAGVVAITAELAPALRSVVSRAVEEIRVGRSLGLPFARPRAAVEWEYLFGSRVSESDLFVDIGRVRFKLEATPRGPRFVVWHGTNTGPESFGSRILLDRGAHEAFFTTPNRGLAEIYATRGGGTPGLIRLELTVEELQEAKSFLTLPPSTGGPVLAFPADLDFFVEYRYGDDALVVLKQAFLDKLEWEYIPLPVAGH